MFWTFVLSIASMYCSVEFFRSLADLIGKAMSPYIAIILQPENITKELNDTFAKYVTERSVKTGFHFICLLGCLYFLKRSLTI